MKNLQALIILIFLSALSSQCCKDDYDYPMDNQTFIDQASSSNSFEIAAGNLALNRGISEDVRAYGDHIAKEHTAVGLELSKLTSAKGLNIPANLEDKERANLELLNNIGVSSFDKEFARIMVSSHQDAIELFTTASSKYGVSDADLRMFAANKTPALKAHYADAKVLQTKVN